MYIQIEIPARFKLDFVKTFLNEFETKVSTIEIKHLQTDNVSHSFIVSSIYGIDCYNLGFYVANISSYMFFGRIENIKTNTSIEQ